MSTANISPAIRVGVLGFGGLGQAAAKVLARKREMILVAAADQKGYAYSAEGLNTEACITTYQTQGSVGYLEPVGTLTNQQYSRFNRQQLNL